METGISQTPAEYALTEFSSGAGCGCKIAPAVLQDILRTDTVPPEYSRLLVGSHSNDDAAVFQLDEEQSLISTTDFFTPIVDDAYLFGQIAAANAISDVYAMGGSPILAIAILGWPVEKLPVALAQRVMEGARAVCLEAGIPLAGGHSIDAPEPIFGLSVNGLVKTARLKKNDTAAEGDYLLLTKPIGVGVLSTAQKRKLIQPGELQLLTEQLTKLNSIGNRLSEISGVSAMTDVTGFGLLGHLIEIAAGSGVSAELDYAAIPILEPAKAYAAQRVIPDATYRNWNNYSKDVQFAPGVNVMEAFNLLPDPQTNGGLLIAVNEQDLSKVQDLLKEHGYGAFIQPIGKMIARSEKTVIVK